MTCLDPELTYTLSRLTHHPTTTPTATTMCQPCSSDEQHHHSAHAHPHPHQHNAMAKEGEMEEEPAAEDEEDDLRAWAALDNNHCEDEICFHAIPAAAAAGGREGGGAAAEADGIVALCSAFYLASPVPALGYPCLPAAEPAQLPPLSSPPPPPASAAPEEEGGAPNKRARGGGGGAAAAAKRTTEDGGFLPWPSAVKKRPRGSCEVCFQLKTQCDKTFPCGRYVSVSFNGRVFGLLM